MQGVVELDDDGRGGFRGNDANCRTREIVCL